MNKQILDLLKLDNETNIHYKHISDNKGLCLICLNDNVNIKSICNQYFHFDCLKTYNSYRCPCCYLVLNEEQDKYESDYIVCECDYECDKFCINYNIKKYDKLMDDIKKNPYIALNYPYIKHALELAVKTKGSIIQYIEDQTRTMCWSALKQDGLNLQYIRKQNYDLCLYAIEQNKQSLSLINEYVWNNLSQESRDYLIMKSGIM